MKRTRLNIFSIPKSFHAFKEDRVFGKLCLTFRSLFSKGDSAYKIIKSFHDVTQHGLAELKKNILLT